MKQLSRVQTLPALALLFVLAACNPKPTDPPAPVTGGSTKSDNSTGSTAGTMPPPMAPASAASPTY